MQVTLEHHAVKGFIHFAVFVFCNPPEGRGRFPHYALSTDLGKVRPISSALRVTSFAGRGINRDQAAHQGRTRGALGRAGCTEPLAAPQRPHVPGCSAPPRAAIYGGGASRALGCQAPLRTLGLVVPRWRLGGPEEGGSGGSLPRPAFRPRLTSRGQCAGPSPAPALSEEVPIGPEAQRRGSTRK